MIKSSPVEYRERWSVRLCWLAAILGGAAGCSRGAPPMNARSQHPVVAAVEGVAIHADDVAAQMRRHGIDRRKALEELIEFELLALASAEIPLPRSAADSESVRNTMVERLVERDIEPRIARNAIPDAEVRALYERGKAHFVHGRLVEVAVLCVFTGARMKPEPRARAESIARDLKTVVDQRPRTVAAFQAIAKDPGWIDRNISLTTVLQGEDAPFPRVVGRAVRALSGPGDTTPLVGDETGYYIARYVSEKAPENVSFADAAAGLRAQMYEPWRRQRFLQLSLDLTSGHDIQVFPENFALLAPVLADGEPSRDHAPAAP